MTKNGHPVRNVVFDLGGVLVDFRPEHCMTELGFSEEAKAAFRQRIYSGLWEECDRIPYEEEEIRALFKERLPEFEQEADALWDHVSLITRERDYTLQWLTQLKARGLDLYVLSNYGKQAFQVNSAAYDFWPLISGKLISYEVRKIKPDPEIYRLFCERFRLVPEECVFIDDRSANVEAAERLGFRGLVFTDHERTAAALDRLVKDCG